MTDVKVLVTGGVRSGKSRHAEGLLGRESEVTYVAPGPTVLEDPDPDWGRRIAAHRARRPASWITLESRDLVKAFAVDGPVIVDCLGTWLTAVLDETEAWDLPAGQVHTLVETRVERAVARLIAKSGPIVVVTNEVGLGVVPAHRSGRLFRDLLGTVNQSFGQACDQVHLVVAGRVLVL